MLCREKNFVKAKEFKERLKEDRAAGEPHHD